MKRIVVAALTAALTISSLFGCSRVEKGGKITVYDKNDTVIAKVSAADIGKNEYFAYLEKVIDEASKIIGEADGSEEKEWEKRLFEGEYEIYTAFDKDVFESIAAGYTEYEGEFSFGCAVTSYDGLLLAAYSSSNKEEDSTNYSLNKTSPFSTIKPLSVYAPAIEKGIISWSSVFEDSPYKQIETATGVTEDWPQNATGIYSYENTNIYDALKVSLNTVAVKTLSSLSVESSLEFLEESFDLSLTYEKNKMKELGEEEVIGNVALGYLNSGVSPVDMAGYYTIFGNGGKYSAPRAVLEIKNSLGETVFTDSTEPKQVISTETAYVMNRLLSGVVSIGGTGESANVDGISLVGKTGTGTDYSGNWFIGVTPEYSCAVWHSSFGEKNCSPKIYAKIISGLEIGPKTFIRTEKIKELVYCKESGKLLSDKCRSVELGYYDSENIPEQCDIHE